MQSHGTREVMQQTVMQNRYISSKSTRKLIDKNIWQMIACSMIIKIIYNREKQSYQIKWYTMVSLYMWSDQNKTWQNQSHYAQQGKMNNQHNQHINVSNKYSNEARKKLPQLESSIKINNHHNQHVNVLSKNKHPSMHPIVSGTLNVQSRDRYPLTDSSNATFASS